MELFRSPPQTAMFPTTASSSFVSAALHQQQSSPSSNLPVIPSPTDMITVTSTSPIPITTSASPPNLPMFLSFPSTSTTTSILMDTVLAAQKLNQQQNQQAFNFMVVKQENGETGRNFMTMKQDALQAITNTVSRNSPPNVIKVCLFFN